MKGGTVGLDLMIDQDAADVARIAGDRDLGKRMCGERDDGTGYGFVIRDRGEIRGVGVVRGVGEGVARDVACLVDPPMRGRGLARLALGFMLTSPFGISDWNASWRGRAPIRRGIECWNGRGSTTRASSRPPSGPNFAMAPTWQRCTPGCGRFSPWNSPPAMK